MSELKGIVLEVDDGCAEGYATCGCCDGTGAQFNGDDGFYYDCKACVGGGTVRQDCETWPCGCRPERKL